MTVPGWGPLVIDLTGLELSTLQVGTLVDQNCNAHAAFFCSQIPALSKRVLHGSSIVHFDVVVRLIHDVRDNTW
jgi:hypothetical protein